jgi:hypothetical protein
MSKERVEYVGAAALFFVMVSACWYVMPDDPEPEPEPQPAPEEDCTSAKNTCSDYSPYWMDACPEGERCIIFKNSCEQSVGLSYQIGCNGDGMPGAPQCNCADGPSIKPGASAYWQIVDGDYTSCLPSWKPDCLTAGLAVIANSEAYDCAKGTRVEFTAGNKADPYGKFDSYDIDVEKAKGGGQFYSIPVSYKPSIDCARDTANHDCRPLWCDSKDCPDAYNTSTTGQCPDGRSPQAGCQDTFSDQKGYVVEFCPASGESCQDATPCE